MDNQQIQDPTTQGVGGIKGLEGLNRLKDEGIDMSFMAPIDYNARMEIINSSALPKEEVGFVGVNDSRYDRHAILDSDIENLSNFRGEMQPWYLQVLNGLTKGVILAGTTFLDGTVGLVVGAGTAINEGRWSALWDNPFSRAMQSVNEWAEKEIPNYYTDKELNSSFTDNIFTGNFIGDKFIKNLGFTVGAFYGGNVVGGLVKATRLPQLIGAITRASKAPAIVTSGIGATISSVNEGRIEAINNTGDWEKLQKAKLEDQFNSIVASLDPYKGSLYYDEALRKATNDYNDALDKVEEDRLKMGNMDLLMNLPILLASNIVQFGRLYANGFKTSRRATNILKANDKYIAASRTGKKIASTILDPLAEGTEELAQSMASTISGKIYEADVNNFYAAKINNQAEQQTVDWIKAFADGINETLNNNSAWEEWFIGSLTGAFGMPRFRSIRNSSGGIQSPVVIEGGIRGEIREQKELAARDQQIVDYMNGRVQSPEFINYYQGLIRHNKYQNDMNNAVERNDELEFKDAEHSQLISDIAMFDNAGKLGDLTTMINAAYDTSDANLEAIVENTSSITVGNDGKQVRIGPFIDENGNPMYSTPEGKQEMIDKLTSTRDDIIESINKYKKIRRSIDASVGEAITDEQLEELTWIRSQIDNWDTRSQQLASEIKPVINNVLGSMYQLRNMYTSIKNREGMNNPGLTEEYNEADRQETELNKAMQLWESVRGLDDRTLVHLLATDSAISSALKDVISNPISGVTADDIATTNKKIDDVGRLYNAINSFNTKLEEYLSNPSNLQKDIDDTTEEVAREEEEERSSDIKERLETSNDVSQFRETLSSIDDNEIKDKVTDSLEKEGNQVAAEYSNIESYYGRVRDAIESMDEDATSRSTKDDALRIFDEMYQNASTLQDISNPHSEYMDPNIIYDEALTDDDNIVKYQNAEFTLLRAMDKVNSSDAFKDRFSEPTGQIDKTDNTSGIPESQVTGDSETSTIPSVNTPATVEQYNPVGDISPEDVIEENESLNNNTIVLSGNGSFYRPSIPEFNIYGMQMGKFVRLNDLEQNQALEDLYRESKGLSKRQVDFRDLYNYLLRADAFNYVNSARLAPGDVLGFMIDPEFNDHTIFLVDKRNGRVVGSLDENQDVVSRYEGLQTLIDKVRKEFALSGNKSGKFIATPTTRVSQIMIGRIPYGTESKSIGEIPNVSDNGGTPIFGIVKNGTLLTNGALNDSNVLKPLDISGKEGRIYLLIPNARGSYSPAAIRVKHFNKEQFNTDDIEVQSTSLYKSILNAINKMAESYDNNSFEDAISLLKKDIYMRDIHINRFNSAKGSGIRFTLAYRDSNGNEVYDTTADGKRIRRELSKVVFTNTLDTSGVLQPKPSSMISDEIKNTLISFDLPFNVALDMINKGAYNKRLIASGILTSNITDARVLSSWFTTDYFDNELNLHKAVNPSSKVPDNSKKVQTPVGGKNSAIQGTPVRVDNNTYGVDLSSNTIFDSNGVRVTPGNSQLILDLAWINSNYPNTSNGAFIWDNKALLPDGRILDRVTHRYITGEQAREIKDKLSNRKSSVENSNRIIGQIAENQGRVDKTKTDSRYYYILEEDGNYHQYERVHTRLGDNWVESDKQKNALNHIKVKLLSLSANSTQYNNYLSNLGKYYSTDLSQYKGKTDPVSRNAIYEQVREAMTGNKLELSSGSSVDATIRSFFTSNNTPVKPANMTDGAFADLLTTLTEIRSNIEARGERFLANNIVLFNKYEDGSRIAGEVDILSVDSNGNFRIYDVKTSKYSFYEFTNKYGSKVNYFENKAPNQSISTKDYYTLQLSAYKNLFESQYHTPIVGLAILPFVLGYNRSSITAITKEKGIMITYNPTVNVPLIGSVETAPSGNIPLLPIFNSALEIQDPINDVLPEYKLPDSKVGYFIRDGKLHKGYVAFVGTINGTDVYMTMVPTISKGITGKDPFVAFKSYMAVFPNGNTVTIMNNTKASYNDVKAKNDILKVITNNPQRLIEESSKNTIISDSMVNVSPDNSAKQKNPSDASGAYKALQETQAIEMVDDEYEDVLVLRRVDQDRPTWNSEEELKWLGKVLPQLTENGRVRIQKGLIRVANQGAIAWGQFSNGIITLSDIAAKGTAYHEAFHAVFNLLLSDSEKQALLSEARGLYGEKTDLQLEEDMAEGFREYVMTRDNKGLLNRIRNFFEDLLTKVANWGRIQPHLMAYYQMINSGRYADSVEITPMQASKNDVTNWDTVGSDVAELLSQKGWTREKFNSVSQQERDQATKCIDL